MLAALPHSIRAIAITARGHGDAGKPASGYDAAQMAADVIAVMDALGIERAIVAGHSMGSWTARRVAATYPDRMLGVVLAGAFATFHDNPGIAGLLEEFRALAIRSIPPTPASGRTARWPARSPRRSWRWSSRRPASPRRASGERRCRA